MLVICTELIVFVLVNAHVFVVMKFIRGLLRIKFPIKEKTRVLTNFCHLCIQASHIEPCFDNCGMPHITEKYWPLIGQKWTTVV